MGIEHHWQFHPLPFQTRSLTTQVTDGNPPKSITGYDPHSQSPLDVSLIVTLKQRNWVWTIPTNAVLHFNCTKPQILLISETECPTCISLFALVWPGGPDTNSIIFSQPRFQVIVPVQPMNDT